MSSIQDIGLSLHLGNMICTEAGTGKLEEKDRGSSSEPRVIVSNPAPPLQTLLLNPEELFVHL